MYSRPLRSNELYHWGMKKGEKSDKHKYVARIEDGVTKSGNTRYRYFYTAAEYRAYKEGLNGNSNQRPTLFGNPTNPNAKPLTSIGNKARIPAKPIKGLVGDKNAVNTGTGSYSGDGIVSNAKETIEDVKENIEDTISDFLKNRKKKKEESKNTKKEDKGLVDKAKEKINNLLSVFGKNKKKEIDSEENNSSNSTVITNQENVEDKEPLKDKKEYVKDLEHPSMDDLNKAEKDAQKIYDSAQKQTLDDLKKQEYELTPSENASLINPYYMYDFMDLDGNGFIEGNRYTDNCSHCTLAYDMRLRGYDVEAAPSGDATGGGESGEEIESWYDGGKFVSGTEMVEKYWNEHLEEASSIDLNDETELVKFMSKAYIDEMAKGGPGARGQFCVNWLAGGGHSMAYEVQKDGSVDIVDCQNNTRNKAEDFDWSSIYLVNAPGGVMRTDNLELTDKAAKNVINKENHLKNPDRSDDSKKASNEKIDDNHRDFYIKDGEKWFYQYQNGVRYVLNPNTGNWTRG